MTSQSIFTFNPASEDLVNTDDLALGTLFLSDIDGIVTGFRYYCPSVAPSTVPIGALYHWTNDAAGTLLAEVTFGAVTPSSWNTVDLPYPVALDASQRYVVVYWTPDRYAFTAHLFTGAVVNGHLTAPADDAITPARNGRFRDPSIGGPSFPASTINENSYFADLLFTPDVHTIFREGGSTPAVTATDGPYTLGTLFTTDVAGQVLGIRYFVPNLVPSSLIGVLYEWTSDTTGVELARATFNHGALVANSWATVLFASPVSLDPAKRYVAAIYTPDRYGATNGFFTGHSEVNGHLTAPADAVGVHNGKFHAGGIDAAFPEAGGGSCYFVDVMFTSGASTTAADTVTFTDAATRSFAAARTGADTVTITDAATRHLAAPRTGADTVTFTDTAVASGSMPVLDIDFEVRQEVVINRWSTGPAIQRWAAR